ncbi:hypothetical protein JL721_4678 [Aureococcus anophagefferens]|nr:hypothetical protein JL721_4678 [Aureococcus anophagefferens]
MEFLAPSGSGLSISERAGSTSRCCSPSLASRRCRTHPAQGGRGGGEPVLDENGEEIQPEVFREEHKLAYHVALIDGDATVVPRGAYLVDAAHQVIKNPAYEGLAYEAAGQLRSYFHFRAPKSERAQKALEKPGVVRAGDFLDPIADDVPAGTFSLYYDPSNTMAIIRSCSRGRAAMAGAGAP